ncbi:4-alpha-glucanotransferase [candidate division KSB1 bacterium]|nr:4-alpha-glucanotransferase [candidate division KSB1 bacterium]
MLEKRAAGILLHITSLPSPYGVGDMGPNAYRFADFLADSGQKYWQILPLTPTDPGCGNSPYSSPSAFAGNPLLISPDLLIEEKLLNKNEIVNFDTFSDKSVDFDRVIPAKTDLFFKAFAAFRPGESYQHFYEQNHIWLEDYARFAAFKNFFSNLPWYQWPEEIRDRHQSALRKLAQQLDAQIRFQMFLQYLFNNQWQKLKSYCNNKGILTIGDIPYYVSYDSCDVWTDPQLFKLNPDKSPQFVAGVPPDYFSKTGQLWGNPVYQWDLMREHGFSWWKYRMQHNFNLYDIVRIDHFRGFIAYWQVPATEKTAINGTWVQAPVWDIFNTFKYHFGSLPIIAEDLGFITDDVKKVIKEFGFPGMKILQFAFDESLPHNPYAPHNLVEYCTLYTGTHDNNTIKGWYVKLEKKDKQRICDYLGEHVNANNIHTVLMQIAWMSVAKLVIIPLQDIFGLDETAIMNRPGITFGNWGWRFTYDLLNSELRKNLATGMALYHRVE